MLLVYTGPYANTPAGYGYGGQWTQYGEPWLKKIVSDGQLSGQDIGNNETQVLYSPSAAPAQDNPNTIIYQVANNPNFNTEIRFVSSDYLVSTPSGMEAIYLHTGVTYPPDSGVIQIFHDAYCCSGFGDYPFAVGQNVPYVSFPPYVSLYHELVHALQYMYLSPGTPPGPLSDALENEAHLFENRLRMRDGLQLRSETDHTGGCSGNALNATEVIKSSTKDGGCVVKSSSCG